MSNFFNYLADVFGCPCDFSPIDEEMWEFCDDTCQSDVTECWRRVAIMATIRNGGADDEN